MQTKEQNNTQVTEEAGQTVSQSIIYANQCTQYAFQLLVTQYKLLSEEDFLKLHVSPPTDPTLQQKTLETVSLSLIPTTQPGSAFYIERGSDDKQVRVIASSEFRNFILKYSQHLQGIYERHLAQGQPDERFWSLLACAAATNLTLGLNGVNAQFLVSDEFKTVRGMLYELSRRIGYEQSGQQTELNDFFNAFNRHKDLLIRNQDHGFMHTENNDASAVDSFDNNEKLEDWQDHELPLTQLLPDYTTVAGCDFTNISSPFCVSEGPDLDDFLDETNYFVAIRTVNAFSCGVLDSVIQGANQSPRDAQNDDQGAQSVRLTGMHVHTHGGSVKTALPPQEYTHNDIEIRQPSLRMFRAGNKLLKNNYFTLNQVEYQEPVQITKRFSEQLWAVQVLARHVWTNVSKIRSQKTFDEYKKQVAKCIQRIENEYAGNEFNTFVERSTIDSQLTGIKGLLGII